MFEIKGTDYSKLRVRIIRNSGSGLFGIKGTDCSRKGRYCFAASSFARTRSSSDGGGAFSDAARKQAHAHTHKTNTRTERMGAQTKQTDKTTPNDPPKANQPRRCALAHHPRASGARRVLGAGTRRGYSTESAEATAWATLTGAALAGVVARLQRCTLQPNPRLQRCTLQPNN